MTLFRDKTAGMGPDRSEPERIPGFDSEQVPRDEPNRHPWIWLVYVIAYSLSIPWYLPREDNPALWLGFPYWVVLSLVATIFIAGFTAFVFHAYWRDVEDDQHHQHHQNQGPRR